LVDGGHVKNHGDAGTWRLRMVVRVLIRNLQVIYYEGSRGWLADLGK
jgi:hypothetical protein